MEPATSISHMAEKDSVTVVNNAFMQAILNSVNAEIAVLDQHGIIRAVNGAWERFAQSRNAAVGSSMIHPGIGINFLDACKTDPHDSLQTAQAVHDGIRAVLAGALPSFSLEYPCHSATQQRWFSLCALPFGQKPKVGVTITRTDITAHKQAQEDKRIAAVAFESQDAIVVMDHQRRVLRVNQAFTRITGYTRDDVLGKTMAMFRSQRENESFYENFWREVMDKKQSSVTHWLQHKSGHDFFARCTLTMIQNEQGITTNYVNIFSDQTLVLRQKEQRLQDEAAHREALVREVHHRIKNNLQGISGLLLQFASEKPEIAEQMQVVAGHLNGISVIHGLQGSDEKGTVRLCELMREIAQTNSIIWQTQIDVAVQDNWVARVVAEKEVVPIALIINEMLVNAIKHGGKAQGHVGITLRQGIDREGVDVKIVNAGHLPHSIKPPIARRSSPGGLQFIELLRPQVGLTITMTQCGDQVHSLLQITAPVLSIVS